MMKPKDGCTLFPIVFDPVLSRIARTPSKAMFRNGNTTW